MHLVATFLLFSTTVSFLPKKDHSFQPILSPRFILVDDDGRMPPEGTQLRCELVEREVVGEGGQKVKVTRLRCSGRDYRVVGVEFQSEEGR